MSKPEQTNTEETLITSKQIKARLWQRISQKPISFFFSQKTDQCIYIFNSHYKFLAHLLNFIYETLLKRIIVIQAAICPRRNNTKISRTCQWGTPLSPSGYLSCDKLKKTSIESHTTCTSYSRMRSAVTNAIRWEVPPLQLPNYSFKEQKYICLEDLRQFCKVKGKNWTRN